MHRIIREAQGKMFLFVKSNDQLVGVLAEAYSYPFYLDAN